jgi:hypothetical protein
VPNMTLTPRFRKKYTLTLLLWASGTALAFYGGAGMGEYTAFATLLLSAFGAADLVDKKLANKGV